jgi:hypothetical protein
LILVRAADEEGRDTTAVVGSARIESSIASPNAPQFSMGASSATWRIDRLRRRFQGIDPVVVDGARVFKIPVM